MSRNVTDLPAAAIPPELTVRDRLQRSLYPREERPRQVYLQEVNRRAKSSAAIIDVGCGRTAPDLVVVHAPQARKVGVDLVDDFRPEAAPGVELVRADCSSLPFDDETFDLLICKSVMEHLADPQAAAREFARVLRPGGACVLLTPNRWDYVSLAASLIPNRFHPWIVRVTTGRAEEDTFPTFYRANSARRLRKLAGLAGLEVVRLNHLREHPHYLKFSLPTYLAGIAFEQVVQRCVHWTRPWLFTVWQKPA